MKTQMKTSMENCLAGIGLALCFATFASLAAETPPATESIMTMRVDGEIAIDPQGKVLDYRIDTKLEPAVRAQLDKAIPKWSFFPVEIEGKPTAVKSKMRLTMAAQEVASGYAVSIDNVVFHDDRASAATRLMEGESELVASISSKSRTPPAYPAGLLRGGVEGAVLIYIHVTPEGKAGQVTAVQSSLFNVRGRTRTLDEALTLLEANTIAAAKRWRFNVPAGYKTADPEYMTVAIPVNYVISGRTSDAPGQWRVEVRNEFKSASWLPASRLAQQVGVSDLGSGELMPLGSRMRLREGGGKAL